MTSPSSSSVKWLFSANRTGSFSLSLSRQPRFSNLLWILPQPATHRFYFFSFKKVTLCFMPVGQPLCFLLLLIIPSKSALPLWQNPIICSMLDVFKKTCALFKSCLSGYNPSQGQIPPTLSASIMGCFEPSCEARIAAYIFTWHLPKRDQYILSKTYF